MSYFQTKADLKFAYEFHDAVIALWKIEAGAEATIKHQDFITPDDRRRALLREASKADNYQEIRADVARGVLRASKLAKRLGVPIGMQSYPPPLLGGPVIDIDLFQAILHDTSYGSGISRQMMLDALNQLVGELESKTQREYRQLINPVYWIRELLVLVVRIPFIIIEASGFDVHIIEDHLFGRLFKIVEIVVFIYILVKLGLAPDQLKDIIDKLIP